MLSVRHAPGPRFEHDDAVTGPLPERKERVLHTRVPEALDRHIKRRARSLGMSVSTVVRHVLLNTFGLVEDVVTDSASIAFSIARTGAEPRGDLPTRRAARDEQVAASGILAWQEAILNVNAVCDRCNAVLRKGSRAAIGLRERPGPHAVACLRCLGGSGADMATRRPERKKR